MFKMKMLRCRPLTWSVLKQTLTGLQHYRRLCVPASLYEKNGKWADLLRKDTMLEIEAVWKERLHIYDEMHYKQARHKDAGKEKFYVLSMFPYPSGKLHMGHVRVYTISDMMARYHRMLGHEVIHPMGWDAFGLPAENAAIERGLHPRDWTYSNIATMKQQLKSLCCAFDWDREVTTCDPSYYKWTQYIFLKMYEAGLIYQREASVNWDPVDQTVLADEQIDENGHSWRSGAKVEKRYLRQWYIRTTAYAQSLYSGLDTVKADLWREVVSLQKNWIGECTGCRLDFQLVSGGQDLGDYLSVFTRYPEAVFGISHIALSTSHLYNQERYHAQEYVKSNNKDEILLSLQARHPMTGENIPVVVSKVSEDSMGSNDSCIGIPCTSEIDRQVADKHGFRWKQVLVQDPNSPDTVRIQNSSNMLNGLKRKEAAESVMKKARETGFGGHPVSSHLRDWLISRQRYWGTPIPMLHCDKCTVVPVPMEDLPVVLPETSAPTLGKGQSALLNNEDWINVKCPKCGGPARRETDTMDTFVDSSWYFLRYLDSTNQQLPVSQELAKKYMPVDLYIGGIEHAYMHLYYARFFNHFLCDIGLAYPREPFVNLITQGMVKGESYRVRKTGEYIPPSQVEQKDGKFVKKGTGDSLIVKYEKMSKSKHNGVDPEDLFKEYGTDMTRLCILSNVAPKSDRNWNNDVYVGVQKWLHRVWTLVGPLVEAPHLKTVATSEQIHQWDKEMKVFRNDYLSEILYHMNTTFLFNTAISRMHEITNDLKKVPLEVAVESAQYRRAVTDLVLMIAPFAPMFSSECWTALRQPGHVLDQIWPVLDEDTLFKLIVLCNANIIGTVRVEVSQLNALTKDTALSIAEQQTFYSEHIKHHQVKTCSLVVRENWSAVLSVIVPELEVSSEEKGHTKTGKRNKYSKEKQQLKTKS